MWVLGTEPEPSARTVNALKLDMITNTFNPGTQEAEASKSLKNLKPAWST